MDQIELFHYRRSKGPLHAVDVKIKLIFFFAAAIAALVLPLLCKGVLLLLLLPLVRMSGSSLLRIVREAVYLIVLLSLLLLTRIIYSPLPPDIEIAFLKLSSTALASAAEYAAALVAVFLLTHILISTTSILQLRNGIYNVLRPLSLRAARTLSLLLALSLGRFPLLVDRYREIREALLSRGLSPRRRPLRWLTAAAGTLLAGLFAEAAQTKDALISRGIDPER
jgi:energy-coupling factor transporter transmembrane protein EcfT